MTGTSMNPADKHPDAPPTDAPGAFVGQPEVAPVVDATAPLVKSVGIDASADAAHDDRLSHAGRLLTGVVHEIKNPLAVIQGYAQLLHDKCTDDADRTDLQAIIDETRRVGALVDDMLSFTRRAPAQAEEVNLSRVVEATVNLTRHVMREASVTVVASLPDEPVRVRGQYGAYVQVLLNLLDNARQSLQSGRAGGRGISIRFEATPNGDASLVVANNGPPIPAEMAPRIFEAFVTSKAPGEGTGLGLALCREILQRYGGSIDIEPTTGESGAAFRVQFPGPNP